MNFEALSFIVYILLNIFPLSSQYGVVVFFIPLEWYINDILFSFPFTGFISIILERSMMILPCTFSSLRKYP